MSTIADLLSDLDPGTLERFPEGRFEIIGGAVVERPDMGAKADWIAALLLGLLQPYVKANGLGFVFGGTCGYQAFPADPKRVRFPDGSFVRTGRLPGDKVPDGHVAIPPDLAIEVISPNDNAYNVEERLTDLLDAGTRLIWVLFPSTRHVMVYRQGPNCTRLSVTDLLDGEDVVPGFTCKIADLFPPSD